MCLPYCNIFNSRNFFIRKTYWPFMGPLHRGYPTYPLYLLSQDIFQTNKHNHSNDLIKGWVSRNDNWKYKTYKNFGIFHKDAILTRHGPLTKDSYLAYPYSCLSQGTFQINKHNHVKQIDVESPEILLRKRKHVKLRGFVIMKTYWQLMDPLLSKVPYLSPFWFVSEYLSNSVISILTSRK